jgi:predicted dehydrogenase
LKILIIGLGSIAKKHILAISTLIPNTIFFALRSNKNSNYFENVNNIFEIHEIPKDINFIIISNPTSLHSAAIKDILFLNKPIFVEKPVFNNILENVELLGLIKNSGIKTYSACNLRFHPSIIFIKNFLEKNRKKINEVNLYCGSYLPSWRRDTNYTESYSSKQNMGGGVHLDLIHELDYAIWLFGFPLNYYSTKRKISQLNIDSIDYCNYNLNYFQFNLSIILNYYRTTPKREIEILFEDDIFICNLLNSEIRNSKNEIIFIDKSYSINNTYLNQAKYFINNLNNDKPYMNNIEESFDILKIALHE